MSSSDFSNTLAIRLTRFLMTFAGFWIWKNRRGKILMDLAMCYTISAIFLAWTITGSDLWYSRKDFAQAAYAACNVLSMLVIIIKLTVFTYRRDAFMNLIKFCYKNFWECKYGAFGESIMRDSERRCVYIVYACAFLTNSTVCTYVLHPILENLGRNETDRILPFNIYLDLPLTTTPYYEIMFIIQTFSVFHSGICYNCFDSFLFMMNVHIAGQFRILQRRFELMCYVSGLDERPGMCSKFSLNTDYDESRTIELADPRDRISEFKACVQKHQSLINFTEMVEEVYTIVIFGQVIIFSVLLCLVAYQAALAEGSLPRRMIFIVHSFGTCIQLFILTMTSDNLIRQSENVAEAAYSALWYCNLSDPVCERLGKDIILVIMRSRRPCCLTAGGFFPVSSETFTTILSRSMSYLTLLRQSQENAM